MDHLRWLSFDLGARWNVVSSTPPLPRPCEVRLDRIDGVLVLIFEAQERLPWDRGHGESEPGTIVKTSTIEFHTDNLQAMRATGAHVVGLSGSSSGDRHIYRATVMVDGVEELERDGSDSDELTAWWTYGPRLRVLWPGLTIYRADETVEIDREGDVRTYSFPSGDSSCDHVRLSLDEKSQIVIGSPKSPESGEPPRMFATFVGVPAREVPAGRRRAVLRCTQFVFGCAIADVGWTVFTNTGRIRGAARLKGYTPAENHGQRSFSPVDWSDERGMYLDREKLDVAFRAYFANRETLQLDRVTWLLVHAQYGPLDRCGATLRAALEVLREASGFRDKPRFEKATFTRIRARLVESLAAAGEEAGLAAEDQALKDVATSFNQLNKPSLTRSTRTYLESIGLRLGPADLAALAFANSAAHAQERETEHNR